MHSSNPRSQTPEIQRFRKRLTVRLKQVCGRRSESQWATRLGVSQQNVHRYLTGGVPHPDFLVVVANRECVCLNWLMLGKGEMHRAA